MKFLPTITVIVVSLNLVMVQSRNIKEKDATGNDGGEQRNQRDESEGSERSEKAGKQREGGRNNLGDGCVSHACAPGSRCSPAEGTPIVHDTGLTYTCRCPRNMYGIFCSIPRDMACYNCVGAGFYCLPTNMHWSGRFCYDTSTWDRILDGNCGRWDFSCDRRTRCVAPSSLCDGVHDCNDGSDELGQHCAESTQIHSGETES